MKRYISISIIISFFASLIIVPQRSYGLNLPAPGVMVNLSPASQPVLIKGLKAHPENPLLFDFILDSGSSGLKVRSPEFKAESEKLIKYFLASLTVKEGDQWVNLSPYEKNRMIPQELGETELGRDMLAQDYILKQLTASLIYPEKKLGKEFWDRVYAKAQKMYGTTQIPVNTFNKVWITADKAKVLERNNAAYVIGAHLKVMLEEDYLALSHQGNRQPTSISSQIIREIILPELEKEVNQGQNFASLRQMFYSMILATWYKQALKTALLNQVYANKSKTAGVGYNSLSTETIYQQYLKAYKKGVFNYIKDTDTPNGVSVPRKYFSGGVAPDLGIQRILDRAQTATTQELESMSSTGDFAMESVNMFKAHENDKAMNSEDDTHIIAYAEDKVAWDKAVELMRQSLEDGRRLIGLTGINSKKEVLLSAGDTDFEHGYDVLIRYIPGYRGWKTDLVKWWTDYNIEKNAYVFYLASPAGNAGEYSKSYYQFHGLNKDDFESRSDHFVVQRDELILTARLVLEASKRLSQERLKKYKDFWIGLVAKDPFSPLEKSFLDEHMRLGTLKVSDISGLPLSAEKSASSPAILAGDNLPTLFDTPEKVKAHLRQRPVVLIVDDNETKRWILNRGITSKNKEIRILKALDGLEGLEMVKKHADEIGLIISDYNMPGLDGAEFRRALLAVEKFKQIPFVLNSTMPPRPWHGGANSFLVQMSDDAVQLFIPDAAMNSSQVMSRDEMIRQIDKISPQTPKGMTLNHSSHDGELFLFFHSRARLLPIVLRQVTGFTFYNNDLYTARLSERGRLPVYERFKVGFILAPGGMSLKVPEIKRKDIIKLILPLDLPEQVKMEFGLINDHAMNSQEQNLKDLNDAYYRIKDPIVAIRTAAVAAKAPEELAGNFAHVFISPLEMFILSRDMYFIERKQKREKLVRFMDSSLSVISVFLDRLGRFSDDRTEQSEQFASLKAKAIKNVNEFASESFQKGMAHRTKENQDALKRAYDLNKFIAEGYFTGDLARVIKRARQVFMENYPSMEEILKSLAAETLTGKEDEAMLSPSQEADGFARRKAYSVFVDLLNSSNRDRFSSVDISRLIPNGYLRLRVINVLNAAGLIARVKEGEWLLNREAHVQGLDLKTLKLDPGFEEGVSEGSSSNKVTDIRELIKSLPKEYRDHVLNSPNYPFQAHSEGPLLADHLQKMLDVLNDPGKYGPKESVLNPYIDLLSETDFNRRLFQEFIIDHELGKAAVKPVSQGIVAGNDFFIYPGYEKISSRLIAGDPRLGANANGDDRNILIEVVRLHGAEIEKISKQAIAPKAFSVFVGHIKAGLDQRKVLDRLIAACFLDYMAADRPDALRRLCNFARAYAVYKKDHAMSGNDLGGIDLNARHMRLDVVKDAQGAVMKFDQVIIADFQRGDFLGIVPVIVRVTTVKNPLVFLGMDRS